MGKIKRMFMRWFRPRELAQSDKIEFQRYQIDELESEIDELVDVLKKKYVGRKVSVTFKLNGLTEQLKVTKVLRVWRGIVFVSEDENGYDRSFVRSLADIYDNPPILVDSNENDNEMNESEHSTVDDKVNNLKHYDILSGMFVSE